MTTRQPRETWWGLPVGAPPRIGYADGDRIQNAGTSIRLDPGSLVLSVARAQRGPVALVQERRNGVVLEQLRSNGTRFVLDAFWGEERLPQGFAVDPTGRSVAYAITTLTGTGRYRIVVRDLDTGDRTAGLTRRTPMIVEEWTAAGVVVSWATDPGGPPLLWRPGEGGLVPITPHTKNDMGPFLLASAPDRAEWFVTMPESGCTLHIAALGARADTRYCRVGMYRPGAWSPDGQRLVARTEPGAGVLDVRSGDVVWLSLPRRASVRDLAWEDNGSVLVVVDGIRASAAMLRCEVGGRCERALPHAGTNLLTLAR